MLKKLVYASSIRALALRQIHLFGQFFPSNVKIDMEIWEKS